MKMFKCTQALILLGILLAHGTNPCAADFQNPQADLESNVEESPDLVDNLRTERGEQLERLLRSKNGYQKKVAFFVGLQKNFGPVSHITDINFDNIVTNIGAGYSASGRFKAPVAGTYLFNANVAAQHGNSAAVTMLKNGLQVMTVWSEAKPNWAPTSNLAILSLREGDQVWLQVGIHSWPSYVYGHMHTTFSGLLIFEG